MFYSITFAPAFERERRFRNDGNVEVSFYIKYADQKKVKK